MRQQLCFIFSAVLLAIVVLFLNACQPTNINDVVKPEYDFSKPDQKVKLPKVLREISGITWWRDHEVAGVQDEDGFVFIIDLKKEKVEDKEKFRKDGDYEDIAKVGKKIYIVRNDGRIYRVKDFDKKDQETKTYETPLSSKNDVEGLCYDKAFNRLLLLCKEQSGIEKDNPNYKAVYAFDLETKELDNRPVLKIGIKDLVDYCEENFGDVPKGDFKPAGIAIHPVSGRFFVISSVMKVLLEVDRKGKLHRVHILPEDIFKQPEGLSFDEAGNLYICNEGRQGKGNILRFNYLLNQPPP